LFTCSTIRAEHYLRTHKTRAGKLSKSYI